MVGGNTWVGTPWAGTPPRQVHPQAGTPPRQVHPQAGTLPRQVHPGRYIPQAGTPPWAGTAPSKYTPRLVHPHGQVPPGSSACWEIRTTSGRYASYWNAFLYLYYLLINSLTCLCFGVMYTCAFNVIFKWKLLQAIK